MSDKVWIFDTTLRDGEQALKASLTEDDKLQLAHTISRLNVDVMEVGFPVSSPADFRAVQRIATEVKGPIICGLARSVAKILKPAVRLCALQNKVAFILLLQPALFILNTSCT